MEKSHFHAYGICIALLISLSPLSLLARSGNIPAHSKYHITHYCYLDNDPPLVFDTVITGKIINEQTEPLTGATVTVKGTGTSATTNEQGSFTLRVPDGDVTLVVTYIGYRTQEYKLNNRNNVSIILAVGNQEMETVVVVGYGTRKRGDVTGSIASVGAEQIRQVPVTNISQALQGRVPGLVASQSSFRPGSGSTIRIRGNRSLQANNNPLYVVDGIPLAPENTIDDINPLDIESIDVLKDASATAIYGSRGANGVIQITTKKAVQVKYR
jgi:TonB-dependent starch-binding outer membrane protein SusC